jgi:plasmid stabilization system protein ParE
VSEVIWSPNALEDIRRLHRLLHGKNPDAANRAAAALRLGARSLAEHPEIGRPMTEMPSEFREWPVPFGGSSYLIFYRYDGRKVAILAVRHGHEAGY